MKIASIKARSIIDSRAFPTIEVEIRLNDGSIGIASVPSGSSKGRYEALELRDNNEKYFHGYGVETAIELIKEEISKEIIDRDFGSQKDFDSFLIEFDGSENKSKYGANTILALSIAFAKATANSSNLQLFRSLNKEFQNIEMKIPTPMFNLLNGGKHANWTSDFQEFMVIFPNFNYKDQLRGACEIYYSIEKLLKERNQNTNVGNEGGFAPQFKNNIETLQFLIEATEKTGYRIGEDVKFSIDFASSEFYLPEKQSYLLRSEKQEYSRNEWITYISDLMKSFPIFSFEDPFAEDDWDSWIEFTRTSSNILVVGDDLLVTNMNRINTAIEKKACNALLAKMNQIGTISETIDAIKLSATNSWRNIVSHRSGETEDVTISHLAVASGSGLIKCGAPARGERTAKYNELLRLEEELFI